MKKIAALCFVLLLAPARSQEIPGFEFINYALDKMELSYDQFGYSPETYWTGYPQLIPYKFPAYDDLFAEPLQMYGYSRSMKDAVDKLLKPKYIKANSDFLYKLLYTLGTSRLYSGFRGYSPNIITTSELTLKEALAVLFNVYDKDLEPRTFGDSYLYDSTATIDYKLKAVPTVIRKPLTLLILNLADAIKWRNTALRDVDYTDISSISKIRFGAFDQIDGQIYYPEFDDVMKTIDIYSLMYSSLKTAAAVDKFRYSLSSLNKAGMDGWKGLEIVIETPAGRIVINGTGNNTTYCGTELLTLDLGGNDIYNGGAAAAGPELPVSILIDLSGDDKYINKSSGTIAQGTGVFGTGVLYDAEGNDVYESRYYSQGMGVFGTGLLVDTDGFDKYSNLTSGQGCGYFGIGMLLDAAGSDEYSICGDGQGMGGVAGLGVLADRSGDDNYFAEPDPKVFNRADYHSDFEVNLSAAQGVGLGRRGDGSDGHNWAGGIGVLIDIEGNDRYISGNFSQALGYWFGLGILYDVKGNDYYSSVYFTQASGAHFAMGILVDEEGDDKHLLGETSGAGLAFGWDWVNAVYIDLSGNDVYEAKKISMGCSMMRSTSFFLELGGSDLYKIGNTEHFLGAAIHNPVFEPGSGRQYMIEGRQVSVFFEADGEDKYMIYQSGKDEWEEESTDRNNTEWFLPARGEGETFNSYGGGFDFTPKVLNLLKEKGNSDN